MAVEPPSRTWNWGIVGLGSMADKFARDLAVLPNARLHAVASRLPDKAAAFGHSHGAGHVYARHEDILDCPGLDVVYIATPHPAHHAIALHCLRHGMPVLCEKPLAMNALQVDEMVAIARDRNVFLTARRKARSNIPLRLPRGRLRPGSDACHGLPGPTTNRKPSPAPGFQPATDRPARYHPAAGRHPLSRDRQPTRSSAAILKAGRPGPATLAFNSQPQDVQ